MQRTLLVCLIAWLSASRGVAQPARAFVDTAALHRGIDAAEGIYEYHGQSTLALVRDAGALVAIIGDAKYPLRAIGGDRYINGRGDTIPFERSPAGKVVAFREQGIRFARRSDVIDARLRARVVPRVDAQGRRVSGFVYAQPASRQDGIRVATAVESQAWRDVVTRIGEAIVRGRFPDVDGVLVHHRGRLVAEEYFHGYGIDAAHPLRSATKSFISTLAGIAIDRGELPGVTAPVASLFARAADAPRSDGGPFVLGDLLSMRTGLACDDWNAASPGNESRLYESPDWTAALFALPRLTPAGRTASYCSVGMLAAGRSIELATGLSLPAYASRVLWAPLAVDSTDVAWNFALDRSNAGSFAQLALKPRDFLKLGLLVAQRGEWNGHRVVSAAWIDSATARRTSIGTRGYGYGWWLQDFDVAVRGATQRVTAISASGNGGQKLYVIPSLELVVAFTGSGYNAPDDSPPNAIMRELLLPAVLTLSP